MKRRVILVGVGLVGIYHQLRNQPVNCGPVDLSGINEDYFKKQVFNNPTMEPPYIHEPIKGKSSSYYDEPKSKYINKPQRNFRRR